MAPPMQLPGHITALYVFATINLMLLCHLSLVEANVYVINRNNEKIFEAADLGAKFGPGLSDRGFRGYLHETEPKNNACRTLLPPPIQPNDSYPWVAIIPRYGCDFSQKVFFAQEAGYKAAIVYNIDSDTLTAMGAGKYHNQVLIPSVFVGWTDGQKIIDLCRFANLERPHRRTVYIYPRNQEIPLESMLIPFIICVGICCFIMIGVLVGKWVRDWRKKRKARLSKQHLKKLPTKKFKKGDEDYDCCAICLDDYEEGDKLRILPCSHAYHMKCVDPWLLNNKRVCPVCKRKVIPGDETDTESESEDEEPHDRATERTPLLASQEQPGTSSPSRASFDNSGLPESVRRETYVRIDSDEDNMEHGTPSSQSMQSWVEVHRGRRSSNGEAEPGRSQSRFPTLASLIQSARGRQKNNPSHDGEANRDRSDSSQSEQGMAVASMANERRSKRRKKRPSRDNVSTGREGSINEGEEGRMMICPAADDDSDHHQGVTAAATSSRQGYGATEGVPGAIGGVSHPLMDVVEDHFSKGKDNETLVPDDATDIPQVEVVSHSRKKRKKKKRDNDA